MSKVAVVGCPNSGKSLLFNRITGLNQKVANFPGATTGTHSGPAVGHPDITLVDFPGIYSLHAISADEHVAVDALENALNDPQFRAVLFVLDTTRLDSAILFLQQVMAACQSCNKPIIVAANMIDVLQANHMHFDHQGLTKELNCPIVPISAKRGTGLEVLIDTLTATIAKENNEAIDQAPKKSGGILAMDEAGQRNRARQLAKKYGPSGDYLLRLQNRIDSVVLHSWGGGILFFVLMFLLFQSIFTWAAPLMDGVESTLSWLAGKVIPAIDEGMTRDFVEDALFGGLGAFLVFVPQIFILTIIIGLLEDSGYLARAAVICHRPLRFFGLTGKSFIPMLSGVACAIPAIYSARTIESPRKRWLTYMAIPLMPCSARLPVYTLLIAAFIPAHNTLGGLMGIQGLAMFSIYLFGIVSALLVTALVSAGKTDDEELPFVLEMPPYRLPAWQSLLRTALERTLKFVREAGPIIFVVTLAVWILGYFPNYGSDLSGSWLGSMGRWIEPVVSPFGLDWRYGVAILTSFLAREVFVGTLGTLFGLGNDNESVMSLAEQIQASGLPLASGLALLVFFAIAMMCVSTLATLARETRSWKLPIQLFVLYGVFAYGMAWFTFWLFS